MSRKFCCFCIIYYDLDTFWEKWGKRRGLNIGGEKIDPM
jgi:hypothetical protein